MTQRVDFRPRPKAKAAPLVRAEHVAPCDVCGDRIGPWWETQGRRLCTRCAPADVKRGAR